MWAMLWTTILCAASTPIYGSAGTLKKMSETRELSSQGSSLYDHAGHARWLIHEADYGVASAQSTLKEGFPFGNVLSMSDGPTDNATGRLLFYVATISQFAKDVAKDDRVSLTVSQEQAEGGTGCKLSDPEWPMCARVTVLGRAKVVPEGELDKVEELMFARHPQMKAWAMFAHEWHFYELHIEHAYVIDWFGGYNVVSRKDYFAATPIKPL